MKNQNDPPVLDGTVSTKIVQEDEAFQFSIPANVFVDPDEGDPLFWQASLSDGVALPYWLRFEPLTRTFYGLPLNEHVGEHQIFLDVRDRAGESASTSFMLRVQNTNDVPLLMPIGDRSSATSQEISFDVNAVDVDVGDVLSWEVSSSDVSLAVAEIEGRNRSATLRLTPVDDNDGNVEVRVLVRDSFGATDEETFVFTVTDSNRPPVLSHLPDVELDKNSEMDFTVSYADSDADDTHKIEVQSENPDAVEILGSGSANGATFTLRAKNDFVGSVAVQVWVQDDGTPALRDEEYFSVHVKDENQAPMLASIADVQTGEETPVAVVVHYSDPNPGDAHTIRFQYDENALGVVGNGNQSGSTFWLVPVVDFVGQTTVDVYVQETGPAGLSDHVQFVVNVDNENDAPVLKPLPDLATSQGQRVSFVVDFDDSDDASGHILAVESSDSAWIVEGDGQVSGSRFELIPQASFFGRVQVRVSVQDPTGASDYETFWVTVSNELAAPILEPIADIEMNEDETYDILVAFSDANVDQSHEVFVNVNGLAVSVVGDGSESPALRTLVPAENENGTATVHIRVVDDVGLSDDREVNLIIHPQNDIPVMQASEWETLEEVPVIGQLAADDVDGDELTFAVVAEPSNGTLRSWDDDTGAFEYLPALDFYGQDSFEVVAKDASSTSIAATIRISVTNTNEAPTLLGTGFTTEEDTPYSGTWSVNDVDGRIVDVIVTRPPLQGTLRVTDPAAGHFQYIPTSDRYGTDSFEVRAVDNEGALSAPLSVDVVITPVNDAPYFVAPTPVEEVVQIIGEADLTFELMALDNDSTQLSYQLTGIPMDATFAPASRVFTWPASLQRLGAYTLTARVSDGELAEEQ